MSTIDIQLPAALKSFLKKESERRGYKDPSEFVQSLLEAERFRSLQKDLEKMLLEASDGPFTEWTTDDVRDIERAGKRLITRRRKQK